MEVVQPSQISSAEFDPVIQARPILHEDISNKKTLLITAGDSWTWGAHLGHAPDAGTDQQEDTEYRNSHVFGRHLADLLDSDFVNYSFCGATNLDIINRLADYTAKIHKHYSDIHMMFVLSEVGRELDLSNYKDDYEILAGASWPKWEDLLAYSVDSNVYKNVLDECRRQGWQIYAILALHLELKKSKDIYDLMRRYEKFTLEYLQSKFSKYIVAHTFTYFDQDNLDLVGNHAVATPWNQVLADSAGIELFKARPKVVMFGFERLLTYVKTYHKHLEDKSMILEIMNDITEVESWWETTSQTTGLVHVTGYPREQGHRWWAEYIFKEKFQ